MNNNNNQLKNIYSLLGMANRAKKIVSGEEIVRNSIRKGEVLLLIISEDASNNTKKRFINTSTYYNVTYVFLGEKNNLGNSIGKSERAVIGITDKGFSDKILKMVDAVIESKTDSVKNAGGELFEQNQNI